ncbi:MAG: cytochrome c maturation protein CcmE, partial [Dehalococcoidia bacterium]
MATPKDTFEETAHLTQGGASFSNPRTKLFLGVGILALAIGYLVYIAFPGNTLYYLTVGELLNTQGTAAEARTVRVIGKLVPDSFQRDRGSVTARFVITDGTQTLPASYQGVLPDLFFNPHSDILLEGRYAQDGQFQADNVIIKCPTKYQ